MGKVEANACVLLVQADITPDYIKGKIADHKAGRIAMSKVRK